MKKKARGWCPTGKIRYSSRAEAVKHMQWIKRESSSEVKPSREYLCDECNEWHLSSDTKPDKKSQPLIHTQDFEKLINNNENEAI
jgi:hypothetical protein